MAALALATEGLVREGKRHLRAICPQPLLNWREARFYAKYGEVELHVLRDLCRPDMDAIDVGANDGCYVHFLKRYARRVYAYEPVSWLADDLRRKFQHDIRSGTVVVSDVALSRSSGSSVIRVPIIDGVLVHGCSSMTEGAVHKFPEAKEIHIRTEPLDRIYSGELGFMKVDVEGHEEAVLEGARETISRWQPRLQVELEESIGPGSIARVAALLRGMGYRGYFIFQHQLKPIEQFDRQSMQNPANYPDLKAGLDQRERFGRYIYNFLFFPRGEREDTLRHIRRRIAAL
ncbi:MAG TPA: FkbM family methyltransferase [Alphaproteobacteria bacterium]|nr:FkbM family methyltransferase [Alphaproteobacteria bacterium]